MKALLALLLFSISAAAQMTESALLQLDRDFAQATSEKRLDGWMKYMMETTVIFGPPNSLWRLAGKEEIQHYYREAFAMPDFSMRWTPKSAQLLPSGNTGYTTGTFQWVSKEGKCHCLNDLHGTYLAVWEREPCPDPGPWKLKALFPSAEAGSVACGCAP
jgi:ketosteroid isomerase-like protein